MELQFLTFCYKSSCQKGQCVAKTICGKFGLITLCQKWHFMTSPVWLQVA